MCLAEAKNRDFFCLSQHILCCNMGRRQQTHLLRHTAKDCSMEFCPDCGSMMTLKDGVMVCVRCGFTKENEGVESFVSVERRAEKTITVLEGQSDAGLPTTRARCEECGNDSAYWWLRQLRSADESETRFFRCTKCGRTWREYD